jgi:hypothetical protein
MRKWSLLVLFAVCACSKTDTSVAPSESLTKAKRSAPAAALLVPVDASLATPPSSPPPPVQPPAPEGAPSPADAAGEWTHFSVKNEVPLCVIADYEEYAKTPLLKDVKRVVKLKAYEPVVFALYTAGCASKECIDRPGMQCWAELEGQTITVESRYNGEQHTGVTCTKDCESVTAACDTPNLDPGTYTLRYGDTTTTFKVPGTLRPACFKTTQTLR